MATPNSAPAAAAGTPAAEPTTADPDLFADLAAAGVQFAADESDDGADGGGAPAPVVVAPPVPVVAAPGAPAAEAAPAPEVSKAEARKMLSAANRKLAAAAKRDGLTKAEIVKGLKEKPGELLRSLGITARDLIAALDPSDVGTPAEPTTEDRVTQLEAARVEAERTAATTRARAEAAEEQRGFEASKLKTIEAVKNQRVDVGGKQVEAYPRINHTGSHELVVELMLGYAERHSPKDDAGNIVADTMVTLSREDAAKQVEKYLTDMGVPATKVAAPPVRPGARPPVPAPRPAAAVAPPAPVVTAKDSAASYEGPAEEIDNFEERKAAVFKELGFDLN